MIEDPRTWGIVKNWRPANEGRGKLDSRILKGMQGIGEM